ncbi:sugar transporter [Prevotella sp.]|uniref:sugar transporter n=2 Tax=Prevotella sp. TaxID=59823 RepID=UPI0027E30174|nr:sugar transporter [Prevotella sp.]
MATLQNTINLYSLHSCFRTTITRFIIMQLKNSFTSWLPLIGLTFAVFVFNTSEFMPIGLLTDIAFDLNISDTRAGLLISVYAWVVALMSLPLMILVSKMELKRLLLGITALFVVSHIISAIADGYYMFMLSRIGVACAHAIFWSIASPLAVRIVPNGRRALGLSTIATGSSVAMVIGLPLGRVIGLYIGWRMTFFCLGVIAAAIFVLIAMVFPRLESRGKFSVKKLPILLYNKVLVGVFVMSVLFATAHYTGYSYIEPFLGRIANMPQDVVTATLVFFGASGMLGSIAFSKYYMSNRYRFIFVVTFGTALSLILMQVAAFCMFTMILVCIFWGAMATAFNIAFQDNTIRFAPKEATSIAMSIFSGIFNLGIGCGAYIGGLVVSNTSVSYIGYAGGFIGILASLYCALRLFQNMRRRERQLSTFQSADSL